jgi:hypothetical protein
MGSQRSYLEGVINDVDDEYWLIRDVVDAVDIYIDCMRTLSSQCVQSLVSTSRLILTEQHAIALAVTAAVPYRHHATFESVTPTGCPFTLHSPFLNLEKYTLDKGVAGAGRPPPYLWWRYSVPNYIYYRYIPLKSILIQLNRSIFILPSVYHYKRTDAYAFSAQALY